LRFADVVERKRIGFAREGGYRFHSNEITACRRVRSVLG
jgi:hypothetical protein